MWSLRVVLACLTVSLGVAGCGAEDAGDGARPTVVASMYPWQYVAERVGGDLVTVETLTAPGQEPHDLELTMQATAQLAEADLAIYSSGLQPAVDEAVEGNGPERVVDVVELAMTRRTSDGQVDPHVWLDPQNLLLAAREVERGLSSADPDHAEDYAANLAALRADLEGLSRDYRQRLRSCSRPTIVATHDAFRYLPTPFEFHSITGLSPDTEPSPARLADLGRLIEEEGVTTVFSETLAGPELARALADEVGVETAVLDPVEGLTDETAGEDYVSLMRRNLEVLAEAAGCR